MKLEWMGKYRNFLESLIHYCNIYSAAYKVEAFEYKGVTYSFAIIQVLEYLIENEERQENMSMIASRLGISRSNFTKLCKKIEEKGLITKTSKEGSKKELNLSVTDFGHEFYAQYSALILRDHFSKMFASLDKIPDEYVSLIENGLRDAVDNAVLK